MSSLVQCAAADAAEGVTRYYAPLDAIVIDNADPLGKHRVRLAVPGLIDASAWAPPLTMGGGSKQRGGHVVPAVGATVVVWFMGGDLESPRYTGGAWAAVEEEEGTLTDEMPSEAGAPATAHKVQFLELDDIKVTVDERDGQRAVAIENKKTGDQVVLDIATGTLTIEATTAIVLRAVGAIQLEAASITLNGRPLLASAAPIK